MVKPKEMFLKAANVRMLNTLETGLRPLDSDPNDTLGRHYVSAIVNEQNDSLIYLKSIYVKTEA